MTEDPPSRRRRVAVGVVVALVLLAIVVGIGYLMRTLDYTDANCHGLNQLVCQQGGGHPTTTVFDGRER